MSYEIEVTELAGEELGLLSGSQAELGPDAGRITWRNSEGYARENSPITDGNRQNVRRFFYGFGAWSRDEIDGWDDVELGGLLVQFIAGDLREAEGVAWDDEAGGIDWDEYQRQREAGRVGGRVYPDAGGRIWFCFAN